MINWKKKGRIYVPDGKGFFKTHVTRPIPYQIDDEVLRIYFASRDDTDTMYPTYIDVDIENPKKVLYVNEEPILNLGRMGTFDDSGIVMGCILGHGEVYYTGWKRRRLVNYEMAMGICHMEQPYTALKRLFEGPMLAQDKNHPIFVTGPFVMYDQKRYKMWYCSATKWIATTNDVEPLYRINYAESQDGINWMPFKEPAVDYKFDGEVMTAPWVIKVGTLYQMWYSYRGTATKEAKNYVIGYAESAEGIKWQRMDDQAGIERSYSGWDSEMVCYPSFFSYGDVTYMFYSGNNVGKGGLGYAVSE